MNRSRASLGALIMMAAAVGTGGCVGPAMQVCRPDPLSHPEIRFDDTEHRRLFADHVYFSKEASSGGHGRGGRGCGCN